MLIVLLDIWGLGHSESFHVDKSDVESSGQKWSRPSTSFSKRVIVTTTDSAGRPVGSDDENDGCCVCLNDAYLIWFTIFSYVCVITSLLSIVANVKYIMYSSWIGFTAIKACVLRVYVCLFLFVCMCVELEWKYFVRRIRFLETWVWRGCTYAFLGIITGQVLFFCCY